MIFLNGDESPILGNVNEWISKSHNENKSKENPSMISDICPNELHRNKIEDIIFSL